MCRVTFAKISKIRLKILIDEIISKSFIPKRRKKMRVCVQILYTLYSLSYTQYCLYYYIWIQPRNIKILKDIKINKIILGLKNKVLKRNVTLKKRFYRCTLYLYLLFVILKTKYDTFVIYHKTFSSYCLFFNSLIRAL